MSRLLVIGCGGVAQVAISKCCQNSKTFTELCIASRTKSKCDALKEKLQPKTDTVITTAKVNADSKDELVALIKEYKPDAVLNVALPYQDLTIMDACLECKVDYIDTANYEPEDTDDPEWRAIYEKRCKEKGFTAYFDYSWQWKMCVVHDLIEIYAGDTFAYDVKGNLDKAEREEKAADKLFAILPEEQGAYIRALWEEFDGMETADSKYAACLDRIQPFFHNTLTEGHTWVESGTTDRAAVEKRMSIVKEFMPSVYPWVEKNIDNAVVKGWLKP